MIAGNTIIIPLSLHTCILSGFVGKAKNVGMGLCMTVLHD